MSYTLPQYGTVIMGVLNLTPDSFSDGGTYSAPDRAIAYAEQMIADGAHIIDIGGESTRPGAPPVSVEDEWSRIQPVLPKIAQNHPVSVDTMKPEIARRALAEGAAIVNDVTGLRDPAMRQVCAEAGCPAIAMHMQGEPRTMQKSPHYEHVDTDVRDFLLHTARQAEADGVKEVWIDPGIGFGKTTEHNLTLLRHTDLFVATGYPVLIGASRKAFIGRLLGTEEEPLPTDQREEGTLAAHLAAVSLGARILRVHNVRAHAQALRLWESIFRTLP